MNSDIHTISGVVPPLVYAFWILASGAATIALLPIPFGNGFKSAVLLSACRGKLMDIKPTHNALGPLSNWTVPQKWFWHFYALGATLNAYLIYHLLNNTLDITTNTKTSLVTEDETIIIVLSLWELHLLRRLFETLIVLKYPAKARMHGIAYIFALAYYTVVPLTLMNAPAMRMVAEWVLSAGALHRGNGRGVSWSQILNELTPVQYMGVGVFLVGSILQCHSHILLRRLSSSSNSGKYKIPRGGLFELVSCPHYFGEIVIYGGLVCLTNAEKFGPWLMLLWVVSNLILAANLTHQWYKTHFKTYPKNRSALIPWLY